MSTCTALIVAAGRGSRFGGPLPKQYALLGGRTVLRHTLDAYRSTLREMGNSCAAACPALGADLQRKLERLGKGLSGTISVVASTEAGVQSLLQDWGRQTVHHYQQRAVCHRD